MGIRLTKSFSDESSDLHNATVILQQRHPLLHPPSSADMRYVRQITKCVTQRASALLATAIHSLWHLRATTKGYTPGDMGPVTIACNGSVIERYPHFRSQTQRYLNQLTTLSRAGPNVISLEMATESALFGAAVAVACLEGI
jgi:hexokinase